jgi:adenylate cyclase
VLFVDDLHWIDPESDAFLAAIAEAVAGTRTMLLVNYRPEYVAPWTELPDHRALDLRPLGAEAVEALTGELLGREPALASLRRRVAERSAGNPFFAEELVQSLAEAGTLSGAKGSYRLTTSEGDVALPATVQAVLDARIDRAGERPKEVLQAAAVIGPEFLERVLARVAELPEDDLRAALDSLRRAEFIVERALYPEAEWAFKHPLTQEAAYRSQLSSRRTRLHAAVARAITDLLPERSNENAALVAHHWELAGEFLEAAKSHGRAAEWIGVRDSAAADRHWRRARELLEEVPETDEALRLRLVACERILGIGWRVRLSLDEVERAFADGREIAARLGDRGASARIAAAHAANRSYFGPDSAEILARTKEAMTYAEETDDRDLRISLLQQFSWVELLRGDVAAGLDVTARGIALAAGDSNLGRNLFGYSPLSSLHCFRGFFLMLGGRVAEGGAELERGIALAREIGDEDSLQFPLGQMSAYAYFSGDAERALPRVLEALDITARIGHRWGLAMAYDCLGHTYLVSGDWRRAADALAEARRARGDVDDPYQTCWLSQGLAEAAIGLGNAAEAVLLAEGAAAIANRWRWPYPECAARLTLCRALRHARGREAAAEIDEELTRIETLARKGRMTAFLAFAAVERAELRGILGDAEGRRTGLEAARRDLVAMGASALADRLRPA